VPRGNAIELRVNAEDPETFAPNPGTLAQYCPPGGLGVRIDSGCYAGYKIPPTYDSLIAKVIVKADDRQAAIARARRALSEFLISGVKTTIPLQQKLLANPDVQANKFDNLWLEKFLSGK